MQALVVGYGSIGKRHTMNLLRLNKINEVLVYSSNPECEKDLRNEPKAKVIKSLDGIMADFAIIANETYKHIDTSMRLAEQGINLFIEKPLSHNIRKIKQLDAISKRKRIKVYVAYNMRFLGAIRFMKEQLSNGILGNLYFAKIEVGQYLPSWRHQRDYSSTYSGQKLKGGGVSLDLSHEIDYMCYLFGTPQSWKTLSAKVSDLKIDSEDVFEGIYKYQNNFICNVHMDYLQQKKKRDIRINGSKGVLLCDFTEKYIKIIKDSEEIKFADENLFDFDSTYMDELKHFIESIEKDTDADITIKDGLQVLTLLKDRS